MNLPLEDREKIRKYFSARPIKRAFLFGSYAKGSAIKELSDIDILVELDHSKPIGLQFFTYQYELEDLLHCKVDLVSAEGLSKHVKPYVDKDKILIYDRAVN